MLADPMYRAHLEHKPVLNWSIPTPRTLLCEYGLRICLPVEKVVVLLGFGLYRETRGHGQGEKKRFSLTCFKRQHSVERLDRDVIAAAVQAKPSASQAFGESTQRSARRSAFGLPLHVGDQSCALGLNTDVRTAENGRAST
jgi:hypothetical protein